MPRAKRTTKRVAAVAADGTATYRVVGKAANGEGSVYFDKGKDRWRATWRTGPNGRGKLRSVTAKTKDDAIRRRDEVRDREATELADGTLGKDPTGSELFVYWLDAVAAPRVKPGTLGAYRKSADLVTARIGDVPVAELSTDRVRRLVADVRTEVEHDDGAIGPRYADPTVKAARTALRQACDEAIELGYHSAPNPGP